MKRSHRFNFYSYCTLLVPLGALAGIGAATIVGSPLPLTILGAALGLGASYLLDRSSGTTP